jgi:hypothetical protein
LFAGGLQRIEALLKVSGDLVLEQSPEVFHRIGFGGATRQKHHLEPTVRLDQVLEIPDLLDRTRDMPTGLVPDKQDRPCDLRKDRLQEGLHVASLALRMGLSNDLATTNVQCSVEEERTVLVRNRDWALLSDWHPGPPQRREAPQLGLILEQYGRQACLFDPLIDLLKALFPPRRLRQHAARPFPTVF